ncbi:Bifunctional glutamine synthetase adenylyltransferase/adenylyl-removing enzyme, partial [Dissostichus eleginoides]
CIHSPLLPPLHHYELDACLQHLEQIVTLQHASFYGNRVGLIKKNKKSFTFSESALYLTAKINEQGPGRKATQTCISAQWPVLIGSLLEALIYLNAGGGRLGE